MLLHVTTLAILLLCAEKRNGLKMALAGHQHLRPPMLSATL